MNDITSREQQMNERPVRVLITGSRKFTELATVMNALNEVAAQHPERHIVVVHGDAQGADRLSDVVARRNPLLFTTEPHPAHWRRPDGGVDKSAGVRRNQDMVNLGADVCLAFYQHGEANRGTSDCVWRARAAGIPVLEHWNGEN